MILYRINLRSGPIPGCYLQSETKIEPDLRIVQDKYKDSKTREEESGFQDAVRLKFASYVPFIQENLFGLKFETGNYSLKYMKNCVYSGN